MEIEIKFLKVRHADHFVKTLMQMSDVLNQGGAAAYDAVSGLVREFFTVATNLTEDQFMDLEIEKLHETLEQIKRKNPSFFVYLKKMGIDFAKVLEMETA